MFERTAKYTGMNILFYVRVYARTRVTLKIKMYTCIRDIFAVLLPARKKRIDSYYTSAILVPYLAIRNGGIACTLNEESLIFMVFGYIEKTVDQHLSHSAHISDDKMSNR